MRPTYRRFKELKGKAQEVLNESGKLEERLANAICEVDLMEEHEVLKHKWDSVQIIIKSCVTHQPEGDEGIYRASINHKSYEELIALKRAIELL